MDRRAFIGVMAGSLLDIPLAVEAQEGRRTPRVGVLYGSSPSVANRCDEGFRQALAELGYIEGKNIFFEVR